MHDLGLWVGKEGEVGGGMSEGEVGRYGDGATEMGKFWWVRSLQFFGGA